MTELAGAVVGWQLGASAAASFLLLRSWKRRAALNEALHELRRPLQALALADAPGAQLGLESPLRLATAALDRLDREINGRRASEGARGRVEVAPLLESAHARWRELAARCGVTVTMRRGAPQAAVDGDRLQLAQAIDNLVTNAIEHGGPEVAIEARTRGDRVLISVADSGGGASGRRRRMAPSEILARLGGRRRRGHGLAVVRGAAASHGGRFSLHRRAAGSRAILELPMAHGSGR